MTDTLASTLARTLKAAADLVPPADHDVVAAVMAGKRRRSRRRFQATTAATAAAAVAAILAAGPFLHARQAPPAKPAGRTVPGVPPISQVWPQAVVDLPARSADGLAYRLRMSSTLLDSARTTYAAADASRIIMLAVGDLGEPVRFDVYESTSGTVTTLGDVRRPPGAETYEIMDMDADDRYLVWVALTDGAGEPGDVSEIWKMSLSTGEAERIASVSGDDDGCMLDHAIVLGAGSVAWRGTDGLYSVPLSGGEPRRVPGSDVATTARSWPWVEEFGGSPSESYAVPARLADAVTRRTVPVQPAPDVVSLSCGPLWCTGAVAVPDPRPAVVTSQRPAAQRPDGTGLRLLPDGYSAELAQDRLVVMRELPRTTSGRALTMILDLDGGRLASLGERGTVAKGLLVLGNPADATPTRRVVNLKAIR